MAVGALNFAAGCLLVTLQMLIAVGTGEFELAHRFSGGWLCFIATELDQAPAFPLR